MTALRPAERVIHCEFARFGYDRLNFRNPLCNIHAMKDRTESPRGKLIRETAVLQLKLLADGIRDAILIPLSLVAALLGLVEGGTNCDEKFRRVVKLGRRSERWINLFGDQPPLGVSHPAGSMDSILNQVESVVMEQYRKGRSAAETRAAVRDAMKDDGQNPAGKDGARDS